MSLDIPHSNPASGPATKLREPDRIPMSVPNQKLAVPDIPGYHLHWMLGTPERISQAQRAGYRFVEQDEVNVSRHGIADDLSQNGSTDMGSQVSVVAGGHASNGGQPTRLILMKLPIEYWNEDQKALESKSDALVEALRGGQMNAAQTGESPSDRRLRYVDQRRNGTMFDKRRS